MLQQIYHPGSATRPKKAATQVSASVIPNPMVGGIPYEMSIADIEEMVVAFGTAARRCREGGLDGVDVHACSGYLIEQFLSPPTTPAPTATAARSRTACGSSWRSCGRSAPKWATTSASASASRTRSTSRAGCRPRTSWSSPVVEPHVDYVSLHMGSYWRFYTLLAPMDVPLGNEMAANARITGDAGGSPSSRLTKPTMVVGRIMTLDHVEHIVAWVPRRWSAWSGR